MPNLRFLPRSVQLPWFVLYPVLSPGVALGAQLVSDDATKIEILKAAFPNAAVSISTQTPLDWSPGAGDTDALQGEKEFDVVSAADEFEDAHALDLLTLKESKDRRLRLQVYDSTLDNSKDRTYVALAHYKFTGIQTYPFCCEWFSRFFLLTHRATGWVIDHSNYSLLLRAKTVSSFRLVDLDGDGVDEILIEADRSGALYFGTFMYVFKIDGTRLIQLAEVETSSSHDPPQLWFTRALDLDKTRAAAGTALYFKTTVYRTDEAMYKTPRVKEDVVKAEAHRPD